MTHRPAVVAFDVIETLMSIEPLRERLTEIGQPPHLLEAWYTRTLRDGMALSATGDFVPFTDVAEAALRGLTGYTVSDEQVAHVMAGFSDLPAFPEALPAMTTLTEAGVRVACLTNGSAYLNLVVPQPNRARLAGGPGDLGRRGVPVEAVKDGVPVRRRGAGRPAAVAGAGRGARLGLPRRQAGRADHRLRDAQVGRVRRAVRGTGHRG